MNSGVATSGLPSEADYYAKVSEKFSEILKVASKNIRTDWEIGRFKELPPLWNEMILTILPLYELIVKDQQYIRLGGMGRESLHLYFVSLWLAEADYVNAARATLRSSLDALAVGILLEREHRKNRRIDPKINKDTETFRKIVHEDYESVAQRIRNEPDLNSPFKYLLYHFEDKRLERRGERREDELKVKFGLNPYIIYTDLSSSVHEAVSYTDTLQLLSPGVQPPSFTDLVPAIFLDFASGATRRELLEKNKQTIDKWRRKFHNDFINATKILKIILDAELKNWASNPI